MKLMNENDVPYPSPNAPSWLRIRDMLYRLLLTKWMDIAGIYPKTGTTVKNRVKELWQPIETISGFLRVYGVDNRGKSLRKYIKPPLWGAGNVLKGSKVL
jgi:hypothetical protein